MPDDDQDSFVLGIGLVQKVNEMNQKIAFAGKFFFDIESMRQEVIKIQLLQTGVRYGCDEGVFIQAFQQPVDEGGLACSDIADQEKKAPVVMDAEFQSGQRFLVGFTKPQESGIRADLEGFFL